MFLLYLYYLYILQYINVVYVYCKHIPTVCIQTEKLRGALIIIITKGMTGV